ncbi:hypothetical protein P7K49_026506 [Saguinus oedipus]|uniref:Uncharacterized protein n=1 Tax=Saguinus oedipus TaxID=9490 RepID=A0ABQ9UDJ8_SAGOE|nr:hypothetical protein P7K49_026506 [Saguinus oedipus]
MATEPKEDRVHFLVLTDVCGNRTYGVVAQYYRPLHVPKLKLSSCPSIPTKETKLTTRPQGPVDEPQVFCHL